MRKIVALICESCKNRNYRTTKSKEKGESKLTVKKFCKFCGQHTLHKEAK